MKIWDFPFHFPSYPYSFLISSPPIMIYKLLPLMKLTINTVNPLHMSLQIVNFHRYGYAFPCPNTSGSSPICCTLSSACILYKWLCFCVLYCTCVEYRLPWWLIVKSLPDNLGDTWEEVTILESGRSPEGGNGIHSSILAWRIPWTKEPRGLRSMESQKSWTWLSIDVRDPGPSL